MTDQEKKYLDQAVSHLTAVKPTDDAAKLPSAARCNRVHQTLLKEPAFKDLLGTKMVPITRRDNVVESYPETVVEVTRRLQVMELDANTATRDEILDEAKAYFAKQASATTPASVTATSNDASILSDGAALAVYSLLLTAKAIAENDRQPNAAARLQALKKALEVYRPCIANLFPSPKVNA